MKPTIISIFDKTEITTGAHKRHIGLLKELKQRGYPIFFFSPVNFLNQENNYFKIPPNKNKFLPKAVQTFLSVRKKIKEFEEELTTVDAILVFGFSHAFASLYPKKKLNIPLIFAVRSNIYEYRRIALKKEDKSKLKLFLNTLTTYLYLWIFCKVEYLVYKKSDKIVVQNEEDFKNLIKNYSLNEKNVTIIRNNINFLKPKTASYKNESSKLKKIIFVGSLSRRKGIMLLVEAVKDLVIENVEIRLEILGDGNLKDNIQSFITQYEIEDEIVMQGYVNDPLKYLANSDLLIMPSLSDSFPNSVLEALYVGTPVIGSDVGGVSEILKYQSLLFKPRSVNAIKNKIKTLLVSDEYQKVKEECMERGEIFIFDWTGKFEKIISNNIINT